jgi:hypothetical protein
MSESDFYGYLLTLGGINTVVLFILSFVADAWDGFTALSRGPWLSALSREAGVAGGMAIVAPRSACVAALQFTGSVASAQAIAATWPACRVVPGGLECQGGRVEVGVC